MVAKLLQPTFKIYYFYWVNTTDGDLILIMDVNNHFLITKHPSCCSSGGECSPDSSDGWSLNIYRLWYTCGLSRAVLDGSITSTLTNVSKILCSAFHSYYCMESFCVIFVLSYQSFFASFIATLVAMLFTNLISVIFC